MTARLVPHCSKRSLTGTTTRRGSASGISTALACGNGAACTGWTTIRLTRSAIGSGSKLADRMKTFQYDPSRSFGGWLRRLCESRIIDFLRQRRVDRLLSLDALDGDPTAEMVGAAAGFGGNHEDEEEAGPVRLALLEKAEKVQALVRARVKPHTWEAFWLVVVYDWTVARTAATLGMSHTAVYNARERVARMLCEEGKC